VYADDPFYRDCRSNNEVGGAIVGAILGGLLGNSVSQGQGGATLAGLILGGVGGAALARNLDCEDRADVYRTYYDGFERGRPRASYQWRNDRTGHYGTLLVGDYYRDPDNYRCATYTQTIYVRGTPQAARGHACRQDDGTWAIID
jgi:surface antigen